MTYVKKAQNSKPETANKGNNTTAANSIDQRRKTCTENAQICARLFQKLANALLSIQSASLFEQAAKTSIAFDDASNAIKSRSLSRDSMLRLTYSATLFAPKAIRAISSISRDTSITIANELGDALHAFHDNFPD